VKDAQDRAIGGLALVATRASAIHHRDQAPSRGYKVNGLGTHPPSSYSSQADRFVPGGPNAQTPGPTTAPRQASPPGRGNIGWNQLGGLLGVQTGSRSVRSTSGIIAPALLVARFEGSQEAMSSADPRGIAAG